MAEATEEPMFDPSLKKRKPKKKAVLFNEEGATPADDDQQRAPAPAEVVVVAETPPPVAPTPGPSILKQPPTTAKTNGADVEGATKAVDDLGFGELKKKKKIPLDFDMEAPPPPAAEGKEAAAALAAAGGDLDFSDLKKKKKTRSTKKATFADLDAFEKELGGGDDVAPVTRPSKAAVMDGEEDGQDVVGGEEGENEDLGEDVFAIGAAPVDVGDDEESWHGTDRDYTYVELLRRITKTLRLQNPELSGRKRYTIVPPQAYRESNKKTIFANISEICKRMHRQPEHVIQFLFAELGTTGTVDGQQRLVIKGRFQQKQLETVLRRYIVEYVTCKICKSPDTLLSKENRLYFMTCESCGSRRSVSAIKTGFQAQIGKRKLTKPAT